MNDLVHRAGKGDLKAQEELIEHLRPRIEKIVRKYAWVNGMDHDDLRQEAYMAVIEGLDRVDVTIGSSSEYLLKFARWRLLDCLKKVLRRKEEALLKEVQTEDAHAMLTPVIELLDGKLSEVQRKILLFLVQGYTWREIGKRLGFTAANVSHHLKKIREVYG